MFEWMWGRVDDSGRSKLYGIKFINTNPHYWPLKTTFVGIVKSIPSMYTSRGL